MKARFWVTLQVEVTAEGADEWGCRVDAVRQIPDLPDCDVARAAERAFQLGCAYPVDVTELVEVIEP